MSVTHLLLWLVGCAAIAAASAAHALAYPGPTSLSPDVPSRPEVLQARSQQINVGVDDQVQSICSCLPHCAVAGDSAILQTANVPRCTVAASLAVTVGQSRTTFSFTVPTTSHVCGLHETARVFSRSDLATDMYLLLPSSCRLPNNLDWCPCGVSSSLRGLYDHDTV